MRVPISAARAAVAALVLATGSSALAQATRTWVSGVGDDANPCSRTAPCKTFAGAFSKTAAGGEIDILDPGDYGGLTVTKAITINGRGSLATVPAPIVIDAGPADAVVLRDLALLGVGSTSSGIQFLNGKTLHVERCTIGQFLGDGIQFTPTNGAQLFVSDVQARDNVGAGIRVQSGSTSVPAQATVVRSTAERNAYGLLVREGGRMTAYDCLVAANSDTGVAALPQGTGTAEANLEEVTLSDNLIGIRSEGGSGTAIVRLSNVVALDEISATTQADVHGSIRSFLDNRILGAIAGNPCAGVSCPAIDCLQAGLCNPETGSCDRQAQPDGTACNDGNACTQTDTCQSGVCTGSNPVTCTAGTCDTSTGTCVAPATPAASSKGCGCQTRGESATASLLFALVVLHRLLRRRRAPASPGVLRN